MSEVLSKKGGRTVRELIVKKKKGTEGEDGKVLPDTFIHLLIILLL